MRNMERSPSPSERVIRAGERVIRADDIPHFLRKECLPIRSEAEAGVMSDE